MAKLTSITTIQNHPTSIIDVDVFGGRNIVPVTIPGNSIDYGNRLREKKQRFEYT